MLKVSLFCWLEKLASMLEIPEVLFYAEKLLIFWTKVLLTNQMGDGFLLVRTLGLLVDLLIQNKNLIFLA